MALKFYFDQFNLLIDQYLCTRSCVAFVEIIVDLLFLDIVVVSLGFILSAKLVNTVVPRVLIWSSYLYLKVNYFDFR